MHAPILALVTVFAASVAAAPLPITPIESPVERAETIVARDAEAALTPLQFEVLKRSIFERLEEIVPVKREADPQCPICGTGDDSGAEKRQLNLDPNEATNDKRSPLKKHGGSENDKRQLNLDPNEVANDKRQLNLDPNEVANNKRQDGTDHTVTIAHDKRDFIPLDSNGSYNDKRQTEGNNQASEAYDKRQLNLDPNESQNDKRQLNLDPNESINDKRQFVRRQLNLDPNEVANDKA